MIDISQDPNNPNHTKNISKGDNKQEDWFDGEFSTYGSTAINNDAEDDIVSFALVGLMWINEMYSKA